MSRSCDEVPPTHLWIIMQREVHFAIAVLFMRTIEINLLIRFIRMPIVALKFCVECNVAPLGACPHDFLEQIDGTF